MAHPKAFIVIFLTPVMWVSTQLAISSFITAAAGLLLRGLAPMSVSTFSLELLFSLPTYFLSALTSRVTFSYTFTNILWRCTECFSFQKEKFYGSLLFSSRCVSYFKKWIMGSFFSFLILAINYNVIGKFFSLDSWHNKTKNSKQLPHKNKQTLRIF